MTHVQKQMEPSWINREHYLQTDKFKNIVNHHENATFTIRD